MMIALLRLASMAFVASATCVHAADVHSSPSLRKPSPEKIFDATSLGDRSDCTDLGETAAEIVVKDNWCKPDGSSSFSNGGFPSECREVAYSVCRGTIHSVADDWCPDEDLSTSELLELQGECEDQVDSMVGGGGGKSTKKPTRRPTRRPSRKPTKKPSSSSGSSGDGDKKCVDDDEPRPRRDGNRFRFKQQSGKDKQCVDSKDRVYEWGEFSKTKTFTDCAEKCVNDVPHSLAFDSGFRGFDLDCKNQRCRCLYDEGTLDSRNTGRFDRSERNEPGKGSIVDTAKKSNFYCAKLAGSEDWEIAEE